MSTVTPEIQYLARHLIALEAARDGSPADGAARVSDRLRGPLVRLAGVAGFRSLLSRALALAKAEVDSLDPVQVREDGSLAGFEGAGPGGVAVVAQLLGLMVTFVGDPLTRQLVRDVWPDAATGDTDGRAGGPS